MANTCDSCGTTYIDQTSKYCCKCRSDMIVPQCDYFRYNTDDFIYPVPWCDKYEARALGKSGLKCRTCSENRK
ncbi:MAG: hypothetical protein ACLFPF_10915 [Halanaerobiales bacterium]